MLKLDFKNKSEAINERLLNCVTKLSPTKV
jgi:hypothetical protein